MFEYFKPGEMVSEVTVGSQLWVSLYAKKFKASLQGLVQNYFLCLVFC